MEPFYEQTHYYAQEALERAGAVVAAIERGEEPSKTDVYELFYTAEDAFYAYAEETDSHGQEESE